MTMLELNHEFLNILQNVLKVFFPPLMSPVPKYGATASNCNLFSHHSYCLCPKMWGKGLKVKPCTYLKGNQAERYQWHAECKSFRSSFMIPHLMKDSDSVLIVDKQFIILS